MTNRERVLALIRQRSGLTDRQIREATGIEPHQQVNVICRRLEREGLVRRERGPHGVINHAVDPTAFTPPRHPGGATVNRRPQPDTGDRWQLGPLDWQRTLLVLPCSAAKTHSARIGTGRSLLDELPLPLAGELAAARRDNLANADLDESGRMAALDRYDGWLYRQLAPARDLPKRLHVTIISGGYGLVLGTEPIGRYDAQFRTGQWPAALIPRCLTAYTARHQLTTVVAFAAASTDYAKPLRRMGWPPEITAWLLTPRVVGGGAMRRAPTAIGQAVAVLLERATLDSTWRATEDTPLDATRLQ